MHLTNFVKSVSLEDFGKEFHHTALWNTRLKTTGGRFFPKDGHLDFNPKIYEQYGINVFRKIVRHELCHYHLYFERKGYRHSDAEFKALLASVDGLRYAPFLKQETKHYLYRCQKCQQEYSRKRLVNTKKFFCGRCFGKLLLVKKQSH